MPTATLNVKITRLERRHQGGYWLNFTGDAEAFSGFLRSIGKLPISHRVWHKTDRVWQISEYGMQFLCWEYPDLKAKVLVAPIESLSAAEQRAQQEREAERKRKAEEAHKRMEEAARILREEVERERLRQQQSRYSSPAPATIPINVSQAFGVLFVVPAAPKEVVRAVYRELCKAAHPDTGGSEAAQKRLNVAYDLICKHKGW